MSEPTRSAAEAPAPEALEGIDAAQIRPQLAQLERRLDNVERWIEAKISAPRDPAPRPLRADPDDLPILAVLVFGLVALAIGYELGLIQGHRSA